MSPKARGDAVVTERDKPRGGLPGGLVGEVIPPDGDEAKAKAFYRGVDAFKRGLKRAIGEVFTKASIDNYLRVFGAVPDRQPYRQWLCAGRDKYVHIADVWHDPSYRKRVLTRIERNRRAWRLRGYLLRDLEYLDEFARQQSPPITALQQQEITGAQS
jgi:hypothetical protein